MRIDIKKTEVYPFDELSGDAKQTAVEQLYDINIYFEWWDYTYEDAANVGIKITEFDIGQGNFCRGELMDAAIEVASRIRIDHGKDCETYKTAVEFLNHITEDEDEDEQESMDLNFKYAILEDYRIMLRKEYEHLASKEAIIETIKANEYEFTKDGKIYR